MIKLVALDMDGTLLNSKKEYSSEFPEWVKSHPQVKTVISSGRQYYALKRDFPGMDDNLTYIAENGAVVFIDDKVCYENSMSPMNVRACLDIVMNIPNAIPLVCGINSVYFTEGTPNIYEEILKYYERITPVRDLRLAIGMDRVLKIAVFIKDFKAHDEYSRLPDLPDETEAVLSGDSWIDIANKGVSKGPALKFLLEKLGIKRSEAMAFGDYPNDLSMLQVVEESYAMANSHPDVIDVAKHITLKTNDEDGVMYTLRSVEKMFTEA